MDLYFKIFEVLFPVFAIIGIGFYLGKKDSKLDTSFITNFAGKIGTPAMIFYTVTTTGVTFNVFIEYFIYAFLLIAGFSLLGLILLFILKRDVIMELPPLILPNTGNMGIPICLFAYGAQGLGIAASIATVIVLLHFTLGVFLAKRAFTFDLLFKNAPTYAIIISVIFLYYNLEVPVFIENTTFLLTYATIFLVLMSLGVALTKLKVVSFSNAIITSISRVIIGPIIGFTMIKAFNLSGFAAGVLLGQRLQGDKRCGHP